MNMLNTYAQHIFFWWIKGKYSNIYTIADAIGKEDKPTPSLLTQGKGFG